MTSSSNTPTRCRLVSTNGAFRPVLLSALFIIPLAAHTLAVLPAGASHIGKIVPLSPWSPSREQQRLTVTREKPEKPGNKEQEITLISDHHHGDEPHSVASTGHQLGLTVSPAKNMVTQNGSSTTKPPVSPARNISSNSSSMAAKQHVPSKVHLEALTTRKLEEAIVVVSVLIIVSGVMAAAIVIYCRHQRAVRRRAYQTYRYSTLEQKEFDDIVDTCDEDDVDTSETPMDPTGPPTLEVKSRNVHLPAPSNAMNGGISKDGTVDMTSAAAAVSLMANGVMKKAGQNHGEFKHLLELDSDEELIH